MKNLGAFVGEFSKKRILVVGDIMVDRFIYGKVSRVSPEAPVPVVEVTKETYMPGGAANVAGNIVAAGAAATVIGTVGDDSSGLHLLRDLRARKIDVSCVVSDKSRPTIVKTRIIAHHQQVVRVDKELKGELGAGLIASLVSRFHRAAKTADAVIISDYGKGIVCRKILEEVIPYCRRKKIPITVDPKIEHFLNYKGVTCLTPNTQEAAEGIRAPYPVTDEAVRAVGAAIMKKLRPATLIITRGEKGMTLFEGSKKITDIPTRAKEVFDVTGAGDTVISIFTLALASGAGFIEAAEIANHAAGIVVGKLGTATVTREELYSALDER